MFLGLNIKAFLKHFRDRYAKYTNTRMGRIGDGQHQLTDLQKQIVNRWNFLKPYLTKRKVDDPDTNLSEKTSTSEGISMNQSPITKPPTLSSSLNSYGQWVANVTAGFHPSLEIAWTKEVIKMTMYICANMFHLNRLAIFA